MATITFTKKAAVVRGGAGRVATEPFVNISENGQLTFNALSMKALYQADGTKYEYAMWGTDAPAAGPKRKETICQLRCFPTPKAWPLKLKGGATYEQSEVAKLNWNNNDKNCGVTISGDLKEIGYNFKESGGQKFKATVDTEAHTITWTVPVGALAKRPVVKREKKVKAATAPNGAVASQVAQATKELSGDAEMDL